MCRGYQPNDTERLRIKSFYTELSSVQTGTVLPDFLTLHFLPRINGSLLQLDGSSIRPDSAAFVTLHRVWSRGCVYGSRERMVVCEGTVFEVYVGDVRMLKGIFRKEEGGNWRMDCKCVVTENDFVVGVNRVGVSVETEGAAAGLMTEMVVVAAGRRRRCCVLEEIPEEREGEVRSDACCCTECGGDEESDGQDSVTEAQNVGAMWAVDVGFWAVCLGVGLLVSGLGASSKKLRRKYFI